MSHEGKIKAAENICKQLQWIIEKKKPDTLILYDALSDEVDISAIEQWFGGHWKIVVIWQDGLFEPFRDTAQTLALIPGRVFTKSGKRIGRGSGYYDKFLAQYPHIQTIGICFACQIFEDIPENTWDKRMEQVVFG